jgi:hypothetical protein
MIFPHLAEILDWIQQDAESCTPVAKKEIKDYCTNQFNSISSSNHLRLGKFVRSSPPGRNHSSNKFPSRRAAFANTASVPRTNSAVNYFIYIE